jgi:hypothetical protein
VKKIYEVAMENMNGEFLGDFDTAYYPQVGGSIWNIDEEKIGTITKVYDDRMDDEGNETGVITIIIDTNK